LKIQRDIVNNPTLSNDITISNTIPSTIGDIPLQIYHHLTSPKVYFPVNSANLNGLDITVGLVSQQ
jgi:hypothetical protein